jgi:hypothetical protein
MVDEMFTMDLLMPASIMFLATAWLVLTNALAFTFNVLHKNVALRLLLAAPCDVRVFRSRTFAYGTSSQTGMCAPIGGHVQIAGETQAIMTKYNFY